jgi:uncharacterized membrane protein
MPQLLKRLNTIIHQPFVRPRFFISGAAGLCVALLLPYAMPMHGATSALIGWNVAIWLYIGLMVGMMAHSSHATIEARAHAQSEGKSVILALVIVAVLACMAAIMVELSVVKSLTGISKLSHIALAATTILSAWVFTHLIFALHYAHDYFVDRAQGQSGGLAFPGTECPSYSDFVYLAFVIGTSGQTADVAFTNGTMRKVGTVHCVLAFLFNTTLLALTINIAAGLIGH